MNHIYYVILRIPNLISLEENQTKCILLDLILNNFRLRLRVTVRIIALCIITYFLKLLYFDLYTCYTKYVYFDF